MFFSAPDISGASLEGEGAGIDYLAVINIHRSTTYIHHIRKGDIISGDGDSEDDQVTELIHLLPPWRTPNPPKLICFSIHNSLASHVSVTCQTQHLHASFTVTLKTD